VLSERSTVLISARSFSIDDTENGDTNRLSSAFSFRISSLYPRPPRKLSAKQGRGFSLREINDKRTDNKHARGGERGERGGDYDWPARRVANCWIAPIKSGGGRQRSFLRANRDVAVSDGNWRSVARSRRIRSDNLICTSKHIRTNDWQISHKSINIVYVLFFSGVLEFSFTYMEMKMLCRTVFLIEYTVFCT